MDTQPDQPTQPYQPGNVPPTDAPAPQAPTPASAPAPIAPTPVAPTPQPAQPYTPSPATAPTPTGNPYDAVPDKKSRKLLWIIIAIVVAILVAVGITLLVSLNNANSAAKNYSASLKTYLEDVADAIAGSAGSPSDVAKDIDKITKPSLKEVFLGDLSESYRDAQATAKRADSTVATATNDAELYSNLYTFYTDLTTQREKLISNENQLATVLRSSSPSESLFDTAVDGMVAACKTMVDLTTSAKVPKDAESNVANVNTKTKAVCNDVTGIETAFDNKNSTALVSAMTDYISSGQAFETAYSALKSDYQSIASDVKELAKPVQTLADSL